MPLISTRGAASSRGFGYLGAAGAASYALVSTGVQSNVSRLIIESQGSGEFWGNLNSWPSQGYYAGGQAGNTTKGYVVGGLDFGGGPNSGYNLGQLRYFTYATSGNSVYNSELSASKTGSSAPTGNNNTRGVSMIGSNYPITLFPIVPIEYWTTATGGSVGSFGSMTGTYGAGAGQAVFNNTRMICAGGNKGQFGGGDTPISSMNYITTATTGNSSFFGNISRGATFGTLHSAASDTRGLFAGAAITSGSYSGIDEITIGTTGNTAAYSNLTVAIGGRAGGTSNTKTALFFTDASAVEKFTIASTATATAWGAIAGFNFPGYGFIGSPCAANAGNTL